MLAAIARFDSRFRWLIVPIWIVGAIAAARLLPGLSSVVQSNNAQFLPASSPSAEADQLATPFHGADPSGTAIIVAYRAEGPLTQADLEAMGRVEQAVRGVPGVAQVSPGGKSGDGKASEALVTAEPSVTASATSSQDLVGRIRATFPNAGAPPGLSIRLAGPLAAAADASSNNAGNITRFTLLFVVVLLFVVYRAALAPLITLIPAALAVALSSPLVAALARAGLPIASVAQQLLIVLLLGAGADYGLFLCFRVREELAQGRAPREALLAAVTKVGEVIIYSALTVAAALLALLLAPFGLYRGLGAALAIGIGVLLVASLTLTPALLAIFGRAAFWPVIPKPSPVRLGLWGRVAERVVKRPVLTLAAGVLVFATLATGVTGYRTGGLSGGPPPSSDSALGAAVLAAHFPKAAGGSDQLLLRFASPVWDHPAVLDQAQAELAADPVFQSVTGPLGTGRGSLTAVQLAGLRATLGPAGALPSAPPMGSPVPAALYQAYRGSSQFISPDGRTVRYYASLQAGVAGSSTAAAAIPAARTALATVARTTGAEAQGIAGSDATTSDLNVASNTSLELVVPGVLIVILILLGLLLRSLVAPWYLALTVGLSYLASLGFATIAFIHFGGGDGLIFVLPLLMFVFSMALGEDYNILVMSRIREEALYTPELSVAVPRAIGVTGGTITSAGIILAGTFAVLGLVGGTVQAQQLGYSIAFGVALDTFFVRTLLVPSIAILLGRWNWWPAKLPRRLQAPSGEASKMPNY